MRCGPPNAESTGERCISLHLLHTDAAETERDLAGFSSLLSPGEALQASRLRTADGRLQFIMSRWLARTVLGGMLGVAPAAVAFRRTPEGKPYLGGMEGFPGELPRFSLSHTMNRVLLGTCSGGEIGVDVEWADARIEDALEIAKRNFSSVEYACISRSTGEERRSLFYEIWTMKEAYVKAVGRGLSMPLAAVTVPFLPGMEGPPGWEFIPLKPIGECVMSCAAHDDARGRSRWALRECRPRGPAGIEEIRVTGGGD